VISRRQFTKIMALSAAALPALTSIRCRGRSAPYNVLFIAVDDLRPQLGCFGHDQIISPNIDRLAAGGMMFERAFCQVPVCGASRSSLLTGVRPARDRFVSYDTWAEKDMPDTVTLPALFKNHGYHTVSNGKVFHHLQDCSESWSEPPWRPSGDWRNYQLEPHRDLQKTNPRGAGPSTETADVADDAYFDGQIASKTISDLQRLSEMESPFFIAAGFLKPHLPFNAPAKYWDLYPREKIDLADNPFRPKDAPDAALHNWGELRQYTDIPASGPLPEDKARTLVHGYYACVSYTDAQIGRLLDELDRLGLSERTIVVLWGDHGWNLGEHGLWCKHCNFKTSLRAPLILRGPGIKPGRSTRALTEFVDIYPTLCELCGIAAPDHLQGSSLLPVIRQPDSPWKEAVFSRFHAGESIKTDRYSYTEWRDEDGEIYARMLYDHETDPAENVNLAGRPENRELVEKLAQMLKAGWEPIRRQ